MFQNENQFPKRLRTSEPMPNRRTQYKTELCLRFQRGTCDYADRCCFAHGYGHLSGFDKWQELTALDGASRIKYLDENQNPKCSDRSRLCWRVMNGDKCQFGDKCHFNHIKTERESAVISVLNVAGRSEMQQQKKTPWRTKLCNRWMSTGSCPYGFKCCFAHGESGISIHIPYLILSTFLNDFGVFGCAIDFSFTHFSYIKLIIRFPSVHQCFNVRILNKMAPFSHFCSLILAFTLHRIAEAKIQRCTSLCRECTMRQKN